MRFLATPIAIAAAAMGSQVEVVGSIGDDPEGDDVVVALGRAGVGHAALLRDPAGRTPVVPKPPGEERPLPRLEAEDVHLGLGYLVEYRVLVLAEPLAAEAERVAIEAAQYHGAAITAIVTPGAALSEALATAATVLEAPSEGSSRFADLVGRFAAALDRGADAESAFADAVRSSGWERAPA
ncbi:MAG: hypothetical protein H0W07_00955 [Chloroflexi bacterium]|nr:hypothetical protein [Chloroflexota bacterium]